MRIAESGDSTLSFRPPSSINSPTTVASMPVSRIISANNAMASSFCCSETGSMDLWRLFAPWCPFFPWRPFFPRALCSCRPRLSLCFGVVSPAWAVVLLLQGTALLAYSALLLAFAAAALLLALATLLLAFAAALLLAFAALSGTCRSFLFLGGLSCCLAFPHAAVFLVVSAFPHWGLSCFLGLTGLSGRLSAVTFTLTSRFPNPKIPELPSSENFYLDLGHVHAECIEAFWIASCRVLALVSTDCIVSGLLSRKG